MGVLGGQVKVLGQDGDIVVAVAKYHSLQEIAGFSRRMRWFTTTAFGAFASVAKVE